MPEPIHRRILVTGSRTWTRWEVVWGALERAAEGLPPGSTITIVHGACPIGVDKYAATWCDTFTKFWLEHGVTVVEERHSADWTGQGRGAGFRRNGAMVSAGADECLAFIRDQSRGATHCAGLAERRGIPTRRFDWAVTR